MAKGRPTSYKPEYVDQVAKLCALGATDMEIADFFGVNVLTIHRWKLKHPAFCNALTAGKDAADARVERSLYQRALGYSHDDVHIATYEGNTIITPIVKHYPPDNAAAIFWLKNRMRKKWRDKVEHGLTDIEGNDVAPETDFRQLARLIAFALTEAVNEPSQGD